MVSCIAAPVPSTTAFGIGKNLEKSGAGRSDLYVMKNVRGNSNLDKLFGLTANGEHKSTASTANSDLDTTADTEERSSLKLSYTIEFTSTKYGKIVVRGKENEDKNRVADKTKSLLCFAPDTSKGCALDPGHEESKKPVHIKSSGPQTIEGMILNFK